MRKDDLNVHETDVAQNLIHDCFLTLTVRERFHRKEFKLKKIWGYGIKLFMQNVRKVQKQPPVVILYQVIFYNIFILCLWLRIIRRSAQVV